MKKCIEIKRGINKGSKSRIPEEEISRVFGMTIQKIPNGIPFARHLSYSHLMMRFVIEV
jgi:hypothetical protein